MTRLRGNLFNMRQLSPCLERRSYMHTHMASRCGERPQESMSRHPPEKRKATFSRLDWLGMTNYAMADTHLPGRYVGSYWEAYVRGRV